METKISTQSPARVPVAGTAAERCAAAKKLMSVGDYEGARAVLGDLWVGFRERPNLDGLGPYDQAELLLRAGALSGWLGSSLQVPSAQAFAKDLISESIRAFEALGDDEKTAEAQSDLALCYWREGAMDEARVWFRVAQSKANDPANLLRILSRATTAEIHSNRPGDALALLDQAAPFLDSVDDENAHGCYHMQRALALNNLGGPENIDLALIENAAASVHFERTGHRGYFARVQNNMGHLFLEVRRYDEALDHLERALHTLIELGDLGVAAQINDTRARVYIAQEDYAEAEKIAFAAVSALEAGDEKNPLVEALETQAVALARMGRFQSALGILNRAAHLAETAGNLELSGKVFLTMLEEVRSFLSPREIVESFQHADERLPRVLNPQTMSRLRAAARSLAGNAATRPTEDSVPGSFEEEVHKRESELIMKALETANGSVTRAARTLGLTHQGLCYIINHRHKELLVARAPIRVRRKSIIKKR